MATEEDLARELLRLAEDDLVAARALLPAPAVADAIVGFHAQQAVEKSLKAALAASGADFPFTHNVDLLMQLCEDAGLAVPGSLQDAGLLTPYAAKLRYGGPSRGGVGREASLSLASAAVHWAAGVVPPPVG